jgi:hypothetical protein
MNIDRTILNKILTNQFHQYTNKDISQLSRIYPRNAGVIYHLRNNQCYIPYQTKQEKPHDHTTSIHDLKREREGKREEKRNHSAK